MISACKRRHFTTVVREDEIYNWFIAKGNAALCDYEGKPSLAMDGLKRLAGGAFSLHYVLLLAAANFPKPLFDHFVAQQEVWKTTAIDV